MMIEFDHDKDAENRVKHKITLGAAADLLGNPALVERVDDRLDYGEERIIAIDLIQGRVFVRVYKMRGEDADVYRIISLRAATKGESHDFYQALAGE